MGLVPKNLPREIRNTFNIIRNELSKDVYIITEPLKEDCPNCLSDHNGVSVGKFDSSFVAPVDVFGVTITPTSFTRGRCPICYGKGVLESENKTCIKAIVRWNPTGGDSRGVLERTPAGLEGFNVVEVKAKKCHYEELKDCKGAVIDGVSCELLVPPVLRSVNSIDVVAIAYFTSSAVGHDVR